MTRIFPLLAAPLFASMSASCILSEPPRFEPPPNQPPSIDTRATPTSEVWVLGELVTETDGGASSVVALDVDIIDANIDQDLEFRVYVDFSPDRETPSRTSGTVPRTVSGDRTRRELTTIQLASTLFSRDRTCHWVELLVTSDFRSDTREPVLENDLAIATWFVLTPNTEGFVNPQDCFTRGQP